MPEMEAARAEAKRLERDTSELLLCRAEYQRKCPTQSKLSLRQPKVQLSYRDKPMRLSAAERLHDAELRRTQERVDVLAQSPEVCLAVEAKRLEDKERLRRAQSHERQVQGVATEKEHAWRQLTPEQQLESLRTLSRDTRSQRTPVRYLSIADVPAVKKATQRLHEAQMLREHCAKVRRDFEKAHPVRAAWKLKEPRVDDVIRGQPNQSLSRVEGGLSGEIERRFNALRQAENSKENQITAHALIRQQSDEGALERHRALCLQRDMFSLERSRDGSRLGREICRAQAPERDLGL